MLHYLKSISGQSLMGRCRIVRAAPVILMLIGAGCITMPADMQRLLGLRGRGPTIIPPADMTVECDGQGNQSDLTAWLASATFGEGCGGTEVTNDFSALALTCGQAGSATVIFTATDDCNNTATASATFTIADTMAPSLTVPASISVTCGDAGAATTLANWLAAASASDLCGTASIATARTLQPGACTATITWTATDACGNGTSLASTYTTNGDTTAPTMTLAGDASVTVECGSAWEDPGVTIADDCDVLIQPLVTGKVNLHAPGDYVLTYSAVDACGNTGPTLTRNVTVVDTTPPVITLKPSIRLWPPNHQMHALTLADLATVTDQCEGTLDPNEAGTILEIYSDEPDNANGDGNTTGDIAIVNQHAFNLRVERQGGSNGRVYGVRFEVSDASGNTAEATARVQVPHDQSGSDAVDDGRSAGQVVTP